MDILCWGGPSPLTNEEKKGMHYLIKSKQSMRHNLEAIELRPTDDWRAEEHNSRQPAGTEPEMELPVAFDIIEYPVESQADPDLWHVVVSAR